MRLQTFVLRFVPYETGVSGKQAILAILLVCTSSAAFSNTYKKIMKKNNNINLILSVMILIFLWSCNTENECNDCLELTTKSLQYVDSEGINLFFGNQAIYNPENIVITGSNGEIMDIWLQEDNGTIAFDLEKAVTSYQIVLSGTFTDNLEFEQSERKSESCCGNVTFSTKTILNGQEIENNDLIVITN